MSNPPSLPPSLYCLSTHVNGHRVRPAARPPPSLLLPSTNNNPIIVSSRDTTTPSRPCTVSPLFFPACQLVLLLPAILAPAPSAVVLADARPAAWLALAS
jgi:hypothetical protein